MVWDYIDNEQLTNGRKDTNSVLWDLCYWTFLQSICVSQGIIPPQVNGREKIVLKGSILPFEQPKPKQMKDFSKKQVRKQERRIITEPNQKKYSIQQRKTKDVHDEHRDMKQVELK